MESEASIKGDGSIKNAQYKRDVFTLFFGFHFFTADLLA